MNNAVKADRSSSAELLPIRLLLYFNDQVYEKRFLSFYSDFYYRYAQTSLVLGLILLFGDYLVDLAGHPDVTANVYRVTICIPFLALGLACSFLNHARKFWELVMSGLVVALSLMLFLILLEIDKQGGHGLSSWVGILNFTILQLYCFVLLAARFKHALVAGLVIVLEFECAMVFSPENKLSEIIYLTYHVVTIAIIVAGIGWWREFLLRKNYLARTTLEEARVAAELAVTEIADASLRREKALSLMEATLEATDNGILVVDLRGQVVSANRRFAQMWQIPENLLANHDDHALMKLLLQQLQDPPQFVEKIQTLYGSPDTASRDTLLFRDGRVFVRFSHPHKLNQEIIGRVWSFLDITEQHQGEQRVLQLSAALNKELERSESQRGQLHSLLNAIPDLVWMKDPHGVFLSCNQAFEKLIGADSSQIIGKTDENFFPPQLAKTFQDDDKVAIGSPEPLVREEWVTFFSDGHRSLLETVRTCVRNRDGKILGVLGVARDITKVHDLLDALEKARAEAWQSSEAKTAFLANMSHEIRTPLNAVLGFARIGIHENEGRKTIRTFQHLLESGSHLLDVINDIIDFSKIEAGKMTIEIQSFCLVRVVERVFDMLADRAQAKGIALVSNLADTDNLPDFVIGDPLRLRQVLINLIANAIKFTDIGEVRLSINRNGDMTQFQVADTGPGIDAETLSRLFQPFEQADNSITRKHGGSGLGLAISRNMAALMGGDISVESTINQGSKFTLSLPLPEGSPVAEEPNRAPSAGPALTGLRILAAEDVYTNRIILQDLITRLGASITFTFDGQQAVDAVKNAPAGTFDIVLMDIQMPLMDGYEATRLIHSMQPELPVVGLTAHAMNEERDRCLAAGMVAHVAKPIQEEILISAILQHAGRSCSMPATLQLHETKALANRSVAESSASSASSESSEPSASDLPLIEWEALSQRYNNRQDFISKLFISSLETHGNSPQRLRDAARKGDHETVRSLAHALKSIAGNLVAVSLSSLAKQAEQSAADKAADFAKLAEELALQTGELMNQLRIRLG
ncbi:MAG: ATP-binding protein [Sterolibacterium sp.]